MHLILFNFSWMAFNIFLAGASILFGWAFLRTKNKLLKYFLAFCWILFIPNTVYLFTDLINLIHQLRSIDGLVRIIVIIQYFILEIAGFLTFILALYPFEYYLINSKWVNRNKLTNWIIVLFNLLIAFGITLGRVTRINSWDVFWAPQNVAKATLHILLSPDLIGLTVLFALFDIFLYFLFRLPILRYFGFIDKVK